MKTRNLVIPKLSYQIKSNVESFNKYDPVKILWRDALSCNSAWKTEDDAIDELEDNIIISIGQLIVLDNENIIFCRNLNMVSSRPNSLDGGMRIPIHCVTEIIKLKDS